MNIINIIIVGSALALLATLLLYYVIAQSYDDATKNQNEKTIPQLGPIAQYEFASETTVPSKAIASKLCQYKPQIFNSIISQSGNAQRQVFFVKTNSTAHLCIEYTSTTDTEGMFSFPTQLYTNYYSAYVTPTSYANVTADPSYMPLGHNSSVVVTHTITMGNKTGTFWLQNPYNAAFPIVVYSDAPNVDPAEIPFPIRTSGPPITLLSTKIVGYDGGIMEYRDAKPIQ